jgi:hypothetical protein
MHRSQVYVIVAVVAVIVVALAIGLPLALTSNSNCHRQNDFTMTKACANRLMCVSKAYAYLKLNPSLKG